MATAMAASSFRSDSAMAATVAIPASLANFWLCLIHSLRAFPRRTPR